MCATLYILLVDPLLKYPQQVCSDSSSEAAMSQEYSQQGDSDFSTEAAMTQAFDEASEEALREIEAGPSSVPAPPAAAPSSVQADNAAPVAQAPEASKIPAACLRKALAAAMKDKDLSAMSLSELRRTVAEGFGLSVDGLECRKIEIRRLTQALVLQMQAEEEQPVGIPSFLTQALEDRKSERVDAVQMVYLITFSRVLEEALASSPAGAVYKDLALLSHADIAASVRDAFDNPVLSGARGGRPRKTDLARVSFLVVFKEHHADESVHYHVVVRLVENTRFSTAKRTLRERHGLASHFSCTHTQVWSALRYCHIETPAKPEVDAEPHQWSSDGRDLDLFALSQQPFNAEIWRKRREASEKEASSKQAKTVFDLMDLTSLVMSKHLYSKDSLLAYVQKYGSMVMQRMVRKRQSSLLKDIEEIKEWASAEENADSERHTGWQLLCRCAEKQCPHGNTNCTYNKAVWQIFERNRDTLDWED